MTTISLSTMRPINDCEPLPVGQVVSYEDMANPYREGVVIAAEPEQYGQRVVWLDGHGETHVTRNTIDGPGGWELVDRVLTGPAITDIVMLRNQVAREHLENREREQYEVRWREEAGEMWLKENQPEWAKAVLVAELHEDRCDTMTDYFATSVKRVVLLAWSKHTRDLFPEMRKAAAKFEPTAELADAPKDAEHREKWSMGSGYYLSGVGAYRSGWRIEKWSLGGYHSLTGIASDPEARALLEANRTEASD